MKLQSKISLLCLSLFSFLGLILGIAEMLTRGEQRVWGAEKKAEAAAMATANFALSDTKFASEKNLSEARKRANLAHLEVSVSTRGGTKLEAPRTSISSDFDGAVCEYSTSAADGRAASAKARANFIRKDNELARIPMWTLAGLIFGILTSLAISTVLKRRTAELEKSVLKGAREASPNAYFRIGEFEDLAFASWLMKESYKLRTKRECDAATNSESDGRLESSALSESMKDGNYRICGRECSIRFARGVSRGSFYAVTDGSKLVYGKTDSRRDGLEKLSDAVAARAASAALLDRLDPWNAFVEVSKLFSLSHWNVIEEVDGTLMRRGLEDGKWSEEKIPDGTFIISTSEIGRALRFYSEMDIAEDESIINLTSENDGGLFIIIKSKK